MGAAGLHCENAADCIKTASLDGRTGGCQAAKARGRKARSEKPDEGLSVYPIVPYPGIYGRLLPGKCFPWIRVRPVRGIPGLEGHEKRAEEVDRGYRAYFEHNRAYDGYLQEDDALFPHAPPGLLSGLAIYKGAAYLGYLIADSPFTPESYSQECAVQRIPEP